MEGSHLEALVTDFSVDRFQQVLQSLCQRWETQRQRVTSLPPALEYVQTVEQVGRIHCTDAAPVLVVAAATTALHCERSRQEQFEVARRLVRESDAEAVLMAFYDTAGSVRLSLVTAQHTRWGRVFERATFVLNPTAPYGIFQQQFQSADFSCFAGIAEAFSGQVMLHRFYHRWRRQLDRLTQSVQGSANVQTRRRFALLFALRTLFLGFVQRKGWFGGDRNFLRTFVAAYQETGQTARLHRDWFDPLFFQTLNRPPAKKIVGAGEKLPAAIVTLLHLTPYLHPRLFQRFPSVDDQGLWLPDAAVVDFVTFLSRYEFELEEDEARDRALAITPAFLEMVCERDVAEHRTAVYTPLEERDLMCRLALLKWLERKSTVPRERLCTLVFEEDAAALDADQVWQLIKLLERITICDPAVGAGTFLVGMGQLLVRLLRRLYTHPAVATARKGWTIGAWKKHVLGSSLYGVDVDPWAVWICQLRLWLFLFPALPDTVQATAEPRLPNLHFVVQRADALVQRLEKHVLPVWKDAGGASAAKYCQTLEQKKRAFFEHRCRSKKEVIDAAVQTVKSIVQHWQEPAEQPACANGIDTAERRLQAETLRRVVQHLEGTELDQPFVWSVAFAEVFFGRGGFDIVIGNPPYLRRERIGDPTGQFSAMEYRRALAQVAALDFPAFFGESQQQSLARQKLNGRSDLYTYFYLRALRLLNDRGVLAFICANSWLNTQYGTHLQEFFLRTAPLYWVLESETKRSFRQAEVNTVITIAGAPQPVVPPEHSIQFLSFRHSFATAMSGRMWNDLQMITQAAEWEEVRVRSVTVKALLTAGGQSESSGYRAGKWGSWYLKAPKIFFDLWTKARKKLRPLETMAEVREGYATGANNFFFVHPRTVAAFQIEQQYLQPAVMKTRGKATMELDDIAVDRALLLLPKDVVRWQDANVARYVQYGAEAVVPNSRTLRAKRRWWYLPPRPAAPLIAPCGYGDRFWCAANTAKAMVSNSFVEIHTSDPIVQWSVFWTLNHPVGWLFLELLGRSSMGGGLLKVDPQEYRHTWIVLLEDAPARLSALPLRARKVQSVFVECGIDPRSSVPIARQDPDPLPDRLVFDQILFDALELSAEERSAVYRTVCQLVWDRLQRARSKR